MKNNKAPIGRSAVSIIAIGFAIGVAVALAPSARAADSATLRPLADTLPSLSLAPTFDKADGDTGPYVLSLKNTSSDPIKAIASVLLAVASHADKKTRDVSEHVTAPGEVWTIPGLAAGDKITVTADGFAPLELTVP
jgi:hypothetical protein